MASSRLSQISAHLSSDRLGSNDSASETADPWPATSPDIPAPPPTLIIIVGFTHSSKKSIAPYVARYAALYPHARITVLESHFADMSPFPVSTRRSRERGFDEIFRILEPHGPAGSEEDGSPDSAHRVVVHVFSGGGQSRFGGLAAAFRRRFGRALPVRLLVLDSAPAPSRLGLKTRAAAATIKVPYGWLGTVLLVPLALWTAFMITWTAVTWQTDPLDYAFRGLNDPALVPRQGLRLYVLSRSDSILDWREVAEHAAEARGQGYEVRELEVVGSGHVAHAKTDPERYWKAIVAAWHEASSHLGKP